MIILLNHSFRLIFSLIFVFQFDFTSTPWGEDSSPLVETLQSMVKSILTQNEMSGPSAQKHRSLTVEQRVDQMKTQIDNSTKYVFFKIYFSQLEISFS